MRVQSGTTVPLIAHRDPDHEAHYGPNVLVSHRGFEIIFRGP